MIGGVAAAVVGGFFALSNTRASAAGPGRDSCDAITDPFEVRRWTNHAGGYYVCSHTGCSKKVNKTITDHDCCGRCSRGWDCLRAAQRDYDGPGGFSHTYFEGLLRPGVCTVCGEPPEAH